MVVLVLCADVLDEGRMLASIMEAYAMTDITQRNYGGRVTQIETPAAMYRIFRNPRRQDIEGYAPDVVLFSREMVEDYELMNISKMRVLGQNGIVVVV